MKERERERERDKRTDITDIKKENKSQREGGTGRKSYTLIKRY